MEGREIDRGWVYGENGKGVDVVSRLIEKV